MKMKAGDKLYCHKTLPHGSFTFNTFSEGEYYNISGFKSMADGLAIAVIGRFNTMSFFNITNLKETYHYGNYFYTISQIRKAKLDKIFKNSLNSYIK